VDGLRSKFKGQFAIAGTKLIVINEGFALFCRGKMSSSARFKSGIIPRHGGGRVKGLQLISVLLSILIDLKRPLDKRGFIFTGS